MSEIVKNAVTELRLKADEEHDGSLFDLSVLLDKIIEEFEQEGIDYVLEKYGPELIAPPI